MKKLSSVIFILLLSLSFSPVKVVAQRAGALIDILNESYKKNSDDSDKDGASPVPLNINPEGEVIYAWKVRKHFGWLFPADTISPKDLRNNLYAIKFSHKNKAGNFTRIQTIDPLGNPLPGLFSVDFQKMLGIDSEPINDVSLSALCERAAIFELIPDASGEKVLKERCLDADGNLLFSSSIFYPDSSTVVCNLFDRTGIPVKIGYTNEKPIYPLARTTFDKWGNDSVVEFFDQNGQRILNVDSAYMLITECDSRGNILRNKSTDMHGRLIIDSVKNCGWEKTYDEHGNVLTMICMDELWAPMPSIHSLSGKLYVDNYEYDKYGRETLHYFTNLDGSRTTNGNGTYYVRTTYGPEYSYMKVDGFAEDGSPAPIYDDERKMTSEESRFKNGKQISYLALDHDGKPYKSDEYNAEITTSDDSNGNRTSYEIYFYDQYGQRHLREKSYTNKKESFTQWADSTYSIEKFDPQGRTVSHTFYSPDGSLDPFVKVSKVEIFYTKRKDCEIKTTKSYDCMNRLVKTDVIESYPKRGINKIFRYDANGNLTECYENQFTKDFNKKLAQYDINRFGNRMKSGNAGKFYSYKTFLRYTPWGESAALIFVDQFGNPDYAQYSPKNYFSFTIETKTDTDFFDVDGSMIDFSLNATEDRPQAMLVEVTDSLAYKYGIRDNDMVLEYGDYRLDWNIRGDNKAFCYWAVHSIINAPKTKQMVVLRSDNKPKPSPIITKINLPAGTPSQLGFKAKNMVFTDSARIRFNQVVANYNLHHPTDTISNPDNFTYQQGDLPLAFFSPKKHIPHPDDNFDTLVGDPALILAQVPVEYNDLLWTIDGSEHSLIDVVLFDYDIQNALSEDDSLTSPLPYDYLVITGEEPATSFYLCEDQDINSATKMVFLPSGDDLEKLAEMVSTTQWDKIQEFKKHHNGGKFLIDPYIDLDTLANDAIRMYERDLNRAALNRFEYLESHGYDGADAMIAVIKCIDDPDVKDIDGAKFYAEKSFNNGYTYGLRAVANHYLQEADTISALPYLEILAEINSQTSGEYASPILLQYYANNGNRELALKYLGNVIHFIELTPENAEEIQELEQGFSNATDPAFADGLFHLGELFFQSDKKKAYQYIFKGYKLDPSGRTPFLSLNIQLYDVFYFDDSAKECAEYVEFMESRQMVVRVVDGSPAAQLGWTGEYTLLEYGNWNIFSDFPMTRERDEIIVEGEVQKPYRITVMDANGKIQSHIFDTLAGVELDFVPVSDKDRQKIHKAFKKYLKSQKH